MEKVSLAILLDGLQGQEPLSSFSAAAHCRPYRVVAQRGAEMIWAVKLISLDHPLPELFGGYTVSITNPDVELFQGQSVDPPIITEHEIEWVCYARINPSAQPEQYTYYISMGSPLLELAPPAKGHSSKLKGLAHGHFKIDPLLVISG
jgi:hypothetical protein